MATEKNDFNINLGDTIYSDSELAGRRSRALTVDREVAEVQATASRFRTSAAPCAQPASTATGTTTSSSTTSPAPSTARRIYRRASRRSPTTRRSRSTSKNGLYRTFRWGKNLELFFLDERSFRSAKASQAVRPAISLRPRAAGRARLRSRRSIPSLDEPGGAGLPRRDQRPVADDARRPSARGVREGDQGLDGDLEGRRQRGADPAVLPAARTTAGRATRPSASSFSASCRRT